MSGNRERVSETMPYVGKKNRLSARMPSITGKMGGVGKLATCC